VATTHSFSVGLAERYGTIESIILSNICWWVETNRKNGKNYRQGRYWTYMSTSGFEKVFTYLTERQIWHAIKHLRDEGAIITGNFNKIRYDRTIWYTVSEEVMAIYDPMRADRGNQAPPGEETPPEDDREEEKEDICEEEPENSDGSGGQTGAEGGNRTPPGEETPPEDDVEEEKEDVCGEKPEHSGDFGEQTGAGQECQKGQPHFTKRGNANAENGNSISHGCEMQMTKMAIPFHTDVKWISQGCEMDFTKRGNRSHRNVRPIPLVNRYKKAAAADQEGQNPEKAAAALFHSDRKEEEEFRSLFGALSPELVFSDNFYPEAFEWLNQNDLDTGYLAWIFQTCQEKKPSNLRGMYYRLFFAGDLAAVYRQRKQAAERPVEIRTVSCPACGTIHDHSLQKCPECGLSAGDYTDAGRVARQKKINAMPGELRREYEQEVEKALNFREVGKTMEQWRLIDRKYHLIE
jgi:hypothetical protein